MCVEYQKRLDELQTPPPPAPFHVWADEAASLFVFCSSFPDSFIDLLIFYS